MNDKISLKTAALLLGALVLWSCNFATPALADAKEIYRGGFITLEVEGNSVKATIVRSSLGLGGMKNPYDDIPEVLSGLVSDPKNFTLTSHNEVRPGVYAFSYLAGGNYQVKFEPSRPAAGTTEPTYILYPVKE